jgi:hypothetical protein
MSTRLKMKIKTESGVSITLVSEGSSKIVIFDRPVRIVELKQEEIPRINSFLNSGSEAESVPNIYDINQSTQREKRRNP